MTHPCLLTEHICSCDEHSRLMCVNTPFFFLLMVLSINSFLQEVPYLHSFSVSDHLFLSHHFSLYSSYFLFHLMVFHFLPNLVVFIVPLSINSMCEVISIYFFISCVSLNLLTPPKVEFSVSCNFLLIHYISTLFLVQYLTSSSSSSLSVLFLLQSPSVYLSSIIFFYHQLPFPFL